MAENSPADWSPRQLHDAAVTFLVIAICEWGDPVERKIAAVQQLLDAAAFDARATCYPIFGGIWKSPCEGPDADAATAWLQALTDGLVRGKTEHEIEQIIAALEARHAA